LKTWSNSELVLRKIGEAAAKSKIMLVKKNNIFVFDVELVISGMLIAIQSRLVLRACWGKQLGLL